MAGMTESDKAGGGARLCQSWPRMVMEGGSRGLGAAHTTEEAKESSVKGGAALSWHGHQRAKGGRRAGAYTSLRCQKGNPYGPWCMFAGKHPSRQCWGTVCDTRSGLKRCKDHNQGVARWKRHQEGQRG